MAFLRSEADHVQCCIYLFILPCARLPLDPGLQPVLHGCAAGEFIIHSVITSLTTIFAQIFKIVVPYVMLAMTFAVLNHCLDLPPFSLFVVALALTDGACSTSSDLLPGIH